MTETETEVRRPLPVGYDDDSSPYYLKPNHRDAYQVVEASSEDIRKAREGVRADLERDRDLRVWEAERRRKEARLDASDYRRWLSTHTRANGEPNLATVGDMHGAVATQFGSRGEITLDLEQTIYAEFIAHRTAAQRQAEATAQIKREERLNRIARKCTVCETLAPDALRQLTRRDGSTYRMCDGCNDLLRLTEFASAEVPAGGTRLDAIARWMDNGTESDRSETSETSVNGLRRLLPGRR